MPFTNAAISKAGVVGNLPGTSGIGGLDAGLDAANGAPDPTGNPFGEQPSLNTVNGMSMTGGGAVGGANSAPDVQAEVSGGVPSGRGTGVNNQCMTCVELAIHPGCPARKPGTPGILGLIFDGPGGQPRFCLWCFINGVWQQMS